MTGFLAVILLAQAPTIELRLATRAGDAVCPDEAALKANVSIQLGYSPFLASSPSVYDVQASCSAEGCESTLVISRPAEETQRRTFSSGAGRCDELFQSLASAIAQALTYEGDVGRRLNAIEAPAPLPLLPVSPEPEPPPRVVKTDFKFRGILAGGASVGLSLEPTPVLGASIGVGWRRFSLAAEGRFDLNQTALVSGSTIQSSVVVGTLVPCVHGWGFGACLLMSTAAVHVRGDVELGMKDSASIFLLGPRVLYEYMFSEHVGFHAHVSFQGAFATLSVSSSNQVIWSTSRITGDATAGVIVIF